ncbi:MAG: flagellar hook-basal body complex protein FliE [Rhodospirillales bacterium]|nr:flagellar hook-basal body complex protein FliE [Rhodospirillales bacterium]
MSAIPTITVTPASAARAYGSAAAPPGGTDRTEGGFSGVLHRAIAEGQAADAGVVGALSAPNAGAGNLTEVVTALSRAELTLQTATAIRDRLVQAYQDVMQMPI